MISFARIIVASVLLATFPGFGARGQDWPSKPVKVVVPFAPAGTTDRMGRLIADELTKAFKQQFYIENRVGGADLNPYLALSAIIASGLHGIDAGLDRAGPLSARAFRYGRRRADPGRCRRIPEAARVRQGIVRPGPRVLPCSRCDRLRFRPEPSQSR